MKTKRPAHGSRPAARRWLGSILLALVVATLTAGLAAAQAASVESVAAELSRSRVYRDQGAEMQVPPAGSRSGSTPPALPSSSPSCPPRPVARPTTAPWN